MRIFGKGLGDYIAFTKWFIIFTLAVGVGRLALSLGGVPNSTAKWLSVTVALLIAVLYNSVRVHTSGFGSYKQLLPTFVVLSFSSQVFVAAAVALAIFTAHDNIYSAPEYSGGGDGKNWGHVGAHLVAGLVVAPLIAWLIGSLVMLVTKLVKPAKAAPVGA